MRLWLRLCVWCIFCDFFPLRRAFFVTRRWFFPPRGVEKSLPNKLYKKILETKNNPFITFYTQYEKSGRNLENPVYEIITQLK